MVFPNRDRIAMRWLVLLCVTAAAPLAGCYTDYHERERYLRRSDTITQGAGNAVAHNNAVQTISPWPYWAGNDRINMEGNRAEIAVKRYQANESIPPQTLSTSSVSPGDGGGAE